MSHAVLHVLPHRGGGGETYIDLLEDGEGSSRHHATPWSEPPRDGSCFWRTRVALSAGRTPRQAALSLPRRLPAIARAARRADLVHVHGDTAALLGLPLLHAGPSIVTPHGLHLLRRVGGARRAAVVAGLRAAARAADRVICESRTDRDELAALLPARLAERLVVVHNGIAVPPERDPLQRAAARAELGLAKSEVAALFVGELHERKAPLDAVAAARTARARGAPLVLLVAGDGPQAAAVGDCADAAVRPLGFRDDVARLLGAADLFVMPSAREGLSFAVLEAMSRGLAMVVSDGPGNPEAVGGAGVVVPFADRAALADALHALATNDDQRDRLAAAARERVRTCFTLERFRGQTNDVYRMAMGAGRARTGRRQT